MLIIRESAERMKKHSSEEYVELITHTPCLTLAGKLRHSLKAYINNVIIDLILNDYLTWWIEYNQLLKDAGVRC